jgi:hypothetical protein
MTTDYFLYQVQEYLIHSYLRYKCKKLPFIEEFKKRARYEQVF